jgi:UDP-N-acetylmuramate--alanine ligase
MLPLALIMKGRGHDVAGSDRGFDLGRTPEKSDFLIQNGIPIFPQDGQGLTSNFSALIVSTAIEDGIPEVKRAKELGIPIVKRAELLASLSNAATTSVGIGGTSGKSTTTGMLAWILYQAGLSPTVMNGANFLNFITDKTPFASALIGQAVHGQDIFVTECDESDGSIIGYHPTIAVLNNIALDHKPVSELLPIFRQFLDQSQKQVLNIDNEAVAELKNAYDETSITVGLENPLVDLMATSISPSPIGISAEIQYVRTGEVSRVSLQVMGRHNLENALSAIGAALLCGVKLADSCRYLGDFKGVARRLQSVKNNNEINIIDDFAHNPDKIQASLACLNELSGRLLVMFQMHGYGPFKLLKDDLQNAFIKGMKRGDILYMPDVLYIGGTVDKSYNSQMFIEECKSKGLNCFYAPQRDDIRLAIEKEVRRGDRIVIMGARDDTLTDFAKSIHI